MKPIELATVMFSQLKEELGLDGLITAPIELDFGAAMFAGDISGQMLAIPQEVMRWPFIPASSPGRMNRNVSVLTALYPITLREDSRHI